MNIKYMMLALLLTVYGAGAENRASAEQDQISAAFAAVYELTTPDIKKIYKKYYAELEWLDHYYVSDRQIGDTIIQQVGIEFEQVLMTKLDDIIDALCLQYGANPSNFERQQLKNFMMQMIPVGLMQGLVKNAELKSSVYQELLAEQG